MTFLSTPKGMAFLVTLLDVMGLGLIIPVQPYLAQSFGASLQVVTLLGATYSLMQFLWAPLWGALSDRYGRRPILVGTIGLTVVGHLAFAISNSLLSLFLARALAGVGAANIAAAQAVMSDTSEGTDRSRSMALIGAAFGLGFVLGPALGGLLAQVGPQAPAIFAALLSFFSAILVVFRLPETRRPGSGTTVRHLGNVTSFFSLPRATRRMITTTFLAITAFALMEQGLALYIERVWIDLTSHTRVADASRMNSIFLVAAGVSAIVVQGFLVRRLLRSHSESVLIRTGLAALGLGFLLMPVLGAFEWFPLFVGTAPVIALGSGLFNPAMSGLISQQSSPDDVGLTLALNQSAAALGRIAGPVFAGTLFALAAPAPFLLAAAIAAAALIVAQQTFTMPLDWTASEAKKTA